MPMKIEKIQTTTSAPDEERLRQLKQLFPECLTEGKLDLSKLNTLLNINGGGGGGRGK